MNPTFGTALGSRGFDSLRNGENTRTAILDAAENLFAAASFDIVSMRDVAAKAKVPLGLINYHFQSKEKLFEAIIARRSSTSVTTHGPTRQ